MNRSDPRKRERLWTILITCVLVGLVLAISAWIVIAVEPMPLPGGLV